MWKRVYPWIFFAIGIIWITGMMLAFFKWVPGGRDGVNWQEINGIIGLVMKHVVRHYVIVIAILFSSWVAGSRIGDALKLEYKGAFEEVVLSTVLGVVFHSMAVMLLGFLHLLYTPVLLLLVITPPVIWRKTLVEKGRGVIVAWRNVRFTGVQLVLLTVLLICVLLTSLNPLYPPTAIDAVNYNLTIPKAYLNSGWLVLDPYIKYSMAPNNQTLLFTMAMAFGNEITSTLTHWATWVLLLMALIAFGSRYLTATGGLCGAIAFALIPVTTGTAIWGVSENFVALFAFLGFWGMWRFMQTRSTGDAILSGIFLGFAMGAKIFLGMLWIGVILYGAIYLILRTHQFPIRRFLLLLLVSIVIVSPWFIRNIVYFGNPFFPYFNERFAAFGGIYQEYEEDIQSDVKAGLKNFSPEKNDVNLFNIAQEMTFWPGTGSKPGKKEQWRFGELGHLGIGPLFIALLPLLVFVRRRWNVLAMMLILSVFFILMWFYGLKVTYIRYWSFFFPFLMSAGGFAFAETFNLEKQSMRKPFGLFFISLISLLILLMFMNNVMPQPGGGHLPLDENSRHSLLTREVVGYSIIEKLNRMDPEPRVYYLYGAPARYYCDFFVIAGYTSPHNYHRFWEHARSGKELASWLREIGVTHLMVNEVTLRNFGKRLPNDTGFKENFIERQRTAEASLYEIKQVHQSADEDA